MSSMITVRNEMLMDPYKKEKDLGGGWGRLAKYRLDPEHPAAGLKKRPEMVSRSNKFHFLQIVCPRS